MPGGGPRVGAGRPSGSKNRTHDGHDSPSSSEDKKQPLEYMLAVMNDTDVDNNRRDRMAVAAAPYLHPKAGESGKKEAKMDAAKLVATGRFSPGAPPPTPSFQISKPN